MIKILYLLSKISIVLGGFFLYGTIGALECNNISFTQAYIQIAIGIAMITPFLIVQIKKHYHENKDVIEYDD